MQYDEIIDKLKALSNPKAVEGMARFGINPENTYGVSIPNLRKMAKDIGVNHTLARQLWGSGVHEARILASMIDDPSKLTEEQMEEWVKDINSWDVCDQVCMNLFEKSSLVWKKIKDWSYREEEFVKRTAFSLIACLAWHDKKCGDEKFVGLFPIIKQGATDERNFVRKAVNWALRNIGKRNRKLNKAAIDTAQEIHQSNSKAARWIAADAIRELESETVQRRLRS
jgi:3-methyladenine DNA glycosylase AlkD